MRRSVPKNIIWAVAHGHDAALSIDQHVPRRGHQGPADSHGRDRQPEDGHPRMELRQRHRADRRYRVPLRERWSRCAISGPKSSSATMSIWRSRRPSAASIATCRRYSRPRCALSATLASISARWTASPSQGTARRPICARASARPPERHADALCRQDLKTGRVMVKDEDVCLHCGLCAERCPTGAWDMRKYLIDMTHAG